MAAVNILALVKITVLLHSSMTTFGQAFILDLIKKSFAKLSRLLFLHLLLQILRDSEGFSVLSRSTMQQSLDSSKYLFAQYFLLL